MKYGELDGLAGDIKTDSKTETRDNFKSKGKGRGRGEKAKFHKPERSAKGTVTSLDVNSFMVRDQVNAVQKDALAVDLVKNLTSLSTLGKNPAGVEMNYSNLATVKRAETLPIFGKVTRYKEIMKESLGNTGFIPSNIVEEIKYTIDTTRDAVSAEPFAINNAVAICPMIAEKQIFHHYRAIHNDEFIPGITAPTTLAENLYQEDLQNLQLTFVDTMGTVYPINQRYLNDDGTDQAFGYISYIYDMFLLKAMRFSFLFKQWLRSIDYSQHVSLRYNDRRNAIDGTVLQASVFLGTIATYFTSLSKFNLPLNYFKEFMEKPSSYGKNTDARDTAIEFVITDVVRPHFRDIYGPAAPGATGNVIMSVATQNRMWDALMHLEESFNWTNYDISLNNNQPPLEYRQVLINDINAATAVLNEFFGYMLNYIQATQRGIDNGKITFYTNSALDPVKVHETIKQVMELDFDLDNGTMIKALNYISTVDVAPQANGTIITTSLNPKLTFKGMMNSSAIQLYTGEEGQYAALYDINTITTFHLNGVRDDRLLLIKNNASSVAGPTAQTYDLVWDGDRGVDFHLGSALLSIITKQYANDIRLKVEAVGVNPTVRIYDTDTFSAITYTVESLYPIVEKAFKMLFSQK